MRKYLTIQVYVFFCKLMLIRLISQVLMLLGLVSGAAGAFAQTCAIPGFSGPSATLSGTVNTYYAGSAAGATGNTVNLGAINAAGAATAFAVGDLLLIMQMQGATINTTDTAQYGDGQGAAFTRQDATVPTLPAPSPTVVYNSATNATDGYAGGASAATAGRYEFAVVTRVVSGTQLNVRGTGAGGALLNTYTQTTGTNRSSYQVIRVPQLSSATITGDLTAPAWDGNSGGVVALDVAGQLTLNAGINVSQRGFRGGGVRNIGAVTAPQFGGWRALYSTNLGGIKGEGIAGTPARTYDSFNNVLSALAGTDGYTNGDVGRGAPGNAGGGGNQHNAGGGGGGNGGAGGKGGGSWNANANGQSGWETGGNGGFPMATLFGAERLFLGGGGGAGDVGGNGSTDPQGSGANGGGIILVRAGSITGAGTFQANGGNAPNTNSTDSSGGGGAGGSILVTVQSGGVAGITFQASGGTGGSNFTGAGNPEQDGPGGGGGGGVVYTPAGSLGTVNSGANGTVTTANTAPNDPPNYYARPGQTGTRPVVNNAFDTVGARAGFECLPNLTVSKSASPTVITSATGATTSYAIVVSNAALSGGVTNLTVFDQTLPPGWTLASPASFSYAPVTSTTRLGVAAEGTGGVVGALPDQNINTLAATFPLDATPDANATTGQNALRWGTFFLDQGGSLTISFTVNIPNTATVGLYHNNAGLSYLDPTRIAGAASRLITPASNNGANRTGTNYTNNTTHASGPTSAVSGNNYSGLPSGPSTEDVRLQPDVSISKTASTSTVAAGQTLNFTLTARNNGRTITDITYTANQATTATNADPASRILASSTLIVTDTFPASMTVTTAFAGTGWSCTQTGQTLSCQRTPTVVPLVGASDLPAIIGTVRVTAQGCPGPVVNSAVVGTPTNGFSDANPANNTSSASVTLNCNANLSITKTNTVTSLVAGSTTSYLISATNTGPASADGAVLRDVPSAGLSCTVSNCTASGGSPVASCPLPASWPNLLTAGGVAVSSLPSGGNVQFTINCGVTATGQ